MSDAKNIKALVFDVFGTVVDWRTSLIDELTAFGKQRNITADWTALVDAWREAYAPSMNEVRNNPARGFLKLDIRHRTSRDKLIERFGIKGRTEGDPRLSNLSWYRLKPSPACGGASRRLDERTLL